MPESRAKTKAGKQRHVAKTMAEFKGGDLKSSSGATVTNPKQAVAVALSETGQSKPPAERKRPRRSGGSTGRLSRELDRRLDARAR
jgi:hypothetical protein